MRGGTERSWRSSSPSAHQALAVLVCCVPILAHADFVTAFKAYKAGNYAAAHADFLQTAELGDGASQYSIGAMAWQGQGTEKDPAIALGWMTAAVQNGYAMDPARLDRLRKELSAQQLAKADAIVTRYGRKAMEQNLLPAGSVACPGWTGASALHMVKPHYPSLARYGQDGFALVEITVGTDGLARDPEVVNSEPRETFDDAAIEAILQSRFEPPRYQGEQREGRDFFLYSFQLEDDAGQLYDMRALKRVQDWADKGHPDAQYVIGSAAYADSAVGLDKEAAVKMVLSAAQGGNSSAQRWIANYIERAELCGGGKKSRPWLEAAARTGNEAAAVTLAELLLRDGDPTSIERARGLLTRVGDNKEQEDAYVFKHATALLASAPFDAVRDPAYALRLGKQLDSKWPDTDPQRKEAFAAALAAQGRYKDAVKEQQRAIKRARELYWNTTLMEDRLHQYENGRAWIGDLFVVPPANNPPMPAGKPAEIRREPE